LFVLNYHEHGVAGTTWWKSRELADHSCLQ